MESEVVLQTQHLKKYYRSVHAVEDISLTVKRGEIFGFLGPNGSGKTTTIGMMLGLIQPTAGSVEVLGQQVTPQNNSVLRRVGTLVGAPSILPPFSARQNLQLLARLYPTIPSQRVSQVLEMVGLRDAANRPTRQFSTGMKQRLGLALALLNMPEVLILDEPTNGMDPAGMHEIRTLLRQLVTQGTTIFLSSHLLHEMELLCDRVAVVQRGYLIRQGAVKDLLMVKETVRVQTADPQGTVQALETLSGATNIRMNGSSVDVQNVASQQVLEHLVMQGKTPSEVFILHPDLESIFLELTQRTA